MRVSTYSASVAERTVMVRSATRRERTPMTPQNGKPGGHFSRRDLILLVGAGTGLVASVGFVAVKIADSLVVTPEDLVAKDPYLWQLREDPMYSWQVDGADRQAPHESPEDLHAWGEPTQSEIIIEHLVHPGVDIKALYEKPRAQNQLHDRV